MIRVILILLVVIVFLLVSALPLLIGEKCVWKNDENRQKEYALKVVKLSVCSGMSAFVIIAKSACF